MTDPVLDRIRRWAAGADQVRVAVLTGSRAADEDEASTDRFSDYDVILYLTEPAALAANPAWLQAFGRVLVSFDDVVDDAHASYTMRLVLFDDGTKIDFALASIDVIQEIVSGKSLPPMLDAGYRIIVDKDGLAARLASPTRTAHVPRRPMPREFDDLAREFWWETTYVAKHLWREELLPAKYSLESVIVLDVLRRTLEWRVEIDRGWRFTPGDLGRGLAAELDPASWAELTAIFAGPAFEDNWEALFRATRLFRRTAIDVAERLGLSYPHDLDARVTAYLESVRHLPRRRV